MSQGPVFPFATPRVVMVVRIVPRETREAGTKRCSVGWVSERVKVWGW